MFKYQFNSAHNKSFTLAEMLITLSIIGIIAALTIPSFVSNHKKLYTTKRLEQIYSKLQNATELAITNTGLEPEDWLTEDKKALSDTDRKQFIYETYIKPYLKTVNYNRTTGSFYDESGAKYTFDYGSNSQRFWIPANTNRGSIANLKVDIDGDKGKNQSGYDIFYFTYKPKYIKYFSYTDGPVIILQGCGVSKPAGDNLETYKNYAYSNLGTCPGCHQNNKGCCGDIIMREGWQIKERYPIKF